MNTRVFFIPLLLTGFILPASGGFKPVNMTTDPNLRDQQMLEEKMDRSNEEARGPLKVGDKVPDFSAPLSDGSTFHLAEWLSKAPLVLYFYPKDDTPGCTTEACGVRDDFSAFKDLHATVIGISYDSVASHQAFIKKYKLPFPLISDEKKEVAKIFKVSGLMFAKRSTFIIGKDGVIFYANPSVNPKTHSQEVRNALSRMPR